MNETLQPVFQAQIKPVAAVVFFPLIKRPGNGSQLDDLITEFDRLPTMLQ